MLSPQRRALLAELWSDDEDIALLEPAGLDVALVGIVYDHSTVHGARGPRAVYDLDKLVRAFCDIDDSGEWTEEDSWEWIEFNVFGSKGDDLPLYLIPLHD